MPARKGGRKQQWLALARTLIAERGFTAATRIVLAKAAAVTVAELSRSFPDDAALLHAVLDDLRDEAFPSPDTMGELPNDAAGRLVAWLDRVRSLASHPTAGFRLLAQALLELDQPDARAEVLARLLEWSEPLVRMLQTGQQAGVVRRSLDASAAAWELMQAIVGLSLAGPHQRPGGTHPAPFDSLLHGVLKVDV